MPIRDVQTTNKQHAVPQNFMDVEFKLIGDLTMRQFTYVGVFGGGAYLSAVSVAGIFKWPLTIILTLLGLALAFVPVQERGLDQWIINFIRSVYSPTQKVWRKNPSIPMAFMYQNLAMVKQELITLTPTSSRRKLEEYLEYQDSGIKVDKLDIPEEEYIQKVKDAFSIASENVPSKISVAVEDYSSPIPLPQESEPAKVETKPVSYTESKPLVKVEDVPKPETNLTVLPKVQNSVEPAVRPSRPQQITLPKHREVYVQPITPDRLSGRRFVSLVPESGEIILPIRGERVLKTSEELNIQSDIEEKAAQLQNLILQIKKQEPRIAAKQDMLQKPKEETNPEQKKPDQKSVELEAENLVENVRRENARLSSEIEKLKDQLKNIHEREPNIVQQKKDQLERLQKEKQKTSVDYSALLKQIAELQTKLQAKERIAPLSSAASKIVTGIPQSSGRRNPTEPNIISGIIFDNAGSILEGAVIIIKNSKNEPVRAIKSNSLGNFSITTPLTNGTYSIEIASSPNSDLTFDILSIEVNGKVIPSLEFRGKLI